MEFKVRRTSSWDTREDDYPPCPGAYYRDGDFYVFIETLQKLVELAEGCNIILGTEGIEIYDDYRE